MGTSLTVLLPSTWSSLAPAVIELFVDWEARLSRFRPSSELARLNAAGGRPRRVSRLLFEVVETALTAAAATDGLFDPTLLDRLEELGYDRSFEELLRWPPSETVGEPAPERETRTPSRGSWRHLRLDRSTRTIELRRGVRLDLGGIAKGMAVDAAIRLLEDAVVPAAAVEAGGDLAVLGPSPEGGRWRVAVELPPPTMDTLDDDPSEPDADPTAVIVEFEAGALATSSIGRRRWSVGGVRRHHLIDPRTGEPAATGVWSATVVAPSCTEAEVAAKVCLLLGFERAPAFLEARGYSGLLLDPGGRGLLVGDDEVELVPPNRARPSSVGAEAAGRHEPLPRPAS